MGTYTDKVDQEYKDMLRDRTKILCDLLGNLIDIIPTTKEGVENKENKKAFEDSVANFRNELQQIARPGKYGQHAQGDALTRGPLVLLNSAAEMYSDLKPKELGGIDMTALTKEISVGGAGSNIKAIYEILKKPAKPEKENPRLVTPWMISTTKIRLALFKSYTKGCLNTAKIARRNYAVISKFISGKVLNPDENTANESAAYYGSMSDLFCEQVFGF